MERKNQKESRILILSSKIKVRKWKSQFIRDEFGNLVNCDWNRIVKEEIQKLEDGK